MERTGVYLLAIACGIFLLQGYHCRSSSKPTPVATSAPETVKTCLPHKYKNVFTQTCTDFDEDSDLEIPGDCPNDMHLKLIPDTKTVTCICNTAGVNVPLIYVQQKKQCYELFRQGPCRAGKVILIKNRTRPGCFDNPCPHMNYDNDDKPIVVFEGKCSRLEGPCRGKNGLDGEITFFRQSLICYSGGSEDHNVIASAKSCQPPMQQLGPECVEEFLGDFEDS